MFDIKLIVMNITKEARGELLMKKKETLKNKLYAVVLILLGAMSVPINNDATAFVFILMLSIPLFFSKENWIK